LKGGQKEVSANTKKLPESYSTSIFLSWCLILVFAATEQHLKGILPVEVLKYSSSTLQQDATMSVFTVIEIVPGAAVYPSANQL